MVELLVLMFILLVLAVPGAAVVIARRAWRDGFEAGRRANNES